MMLADDITKEKEPDILMPVLRQGTLVIVREEEAMKLRETERNKRKEARHTKREQEKAKQQQQIADRRSKVKQFIVSNLFTSSI